jgi:hypothetical protein
MDQIGLSKLYKNLTQSTYTLYMGRQCFHVAGLEATGRLLFTASVAELLAIFKEIQLTQDPMIIITAEKIYLLQDIEFCNVSDKHTIKELERSLMYLNDALRSIETVKSASAYRHAETTHATEHRDKRGGVPKDVMHNACNINAKRIEQNGRTPGLSETEKDLMIQRKINLAAAKESYIIMQKQALTKVIGAII